MKNKTINYITQLSSEKIPDYNEALRQLKLADQLLQKRKKQLRVEAYKEKRLDWHGIEQQKRNQLKKQIQNSAGRLKSDLDSIRRKQEERINDLRVINQKRKQMIYQNRQRSHIETMQEKMKVNKEIRLKSIQHLQRIQKFKLSLYELKRNKHQQLYSRQKTSRIRIKQSHRSRIQQTRQSLSQERDNLLQKLRERHKQLKQLQKDKNKDLKQEQTKERSTTDIKSINSSGKMYKAQHGNRKRRNKSISDSSILGQHALLLKI